MKKQDGRRLTQDKLQLISVASQLPYISKEDIKFFKQKETTEIQIENRMRSRRLAW